MSSLVSLGTEIFLLPQVAWANNAPAFSNQALNATTTQLAAIIQVPKTGTLSALGFRIGSTVTTAQDLRVSWQDFDAAAGNPDGVVDQYRTVASGSISANAWIETGIISSDGTDSGTKRSVTRGQYLCVVIDWSGTAGDITFSRLGFDTSVAASIETVPWIVSYASATWTKSPLGWPWILKYDDGTYAMLAPSWIPATALNSHTVSSSTTPDEMAIRWAPPIELAIAGVNVRVDLDGDVDLVVYNGTTALQTAAEDKDFRGSTQGHGARFLLASDETLTTGNTYYIAVKPTTTTAVTVYSFDVNSTAIMAALPWGEALYSGSRTDAGSWTDNTTRRMFMTPKVIKLHDGAAGGSGGGIRLAGHGGLAA